MKTMKRLFNGYRVKQENVKVNIVQFNNNIIFLGETSFNNAIVIKGMIRKFKLVVVIKVNYTKTKCGAFKCK